MQRKLSVKDKQYIKDNWSNLSLRDIAKHLGVYFTTISKVGTRLGLGVKPHPGVVEQGREQKGKEHIGKPMGKIGFFSMFDDMLSMAAAERKALVERLDQLSRLPDDDHGRVAGQVALTNENLRKLEVPLEKLEGMTDEINEHRPREFETWENFTTWKSMLEYLDKPEVRAEQGRISAKVAEGAKKVKESWEMDLFEYKDGELDYCMLTPEGEVRRAEKERQCDE